jgi:uncharacterized protein with PIN domain
MDFGARYGSFLAAVSSTIVALAYGTSVMVSLKKDQENMRALHSKDLENMRALTEEKIKSAKAEAEEKIKAAKAEAANQAISDYLKYNHSEEYKSLRKSTEKSDSQ